MLRGQSTLRGLGPLELQLQVVGNCLMWVLGAKLVEQQVLLTTKPAP